MNIKISLRKTIWIILFSVWFSSDSCESLISFQAKYIGNLRVVGEGYSTVATSVRQCLAICNKDKSCDSINYFTRMNKCRIFTRCTPIQVVQVSSYYRYYAKRPPISTDDYTYERNSDTCLRITDEKMNYNNAAQLCVEDRSRVMIATSKEVYEFATKLLISSGRKAAWVNYQKDNSNGTKYTLEPQSNTHPSSKSKKCWALLLTGDLKEMPCYSEQLYAICQLNRY